MNRNIKGGFLTLSGVVGIVGMIIVAMQNPATAWVTPPGRMIVSILENGVLIPTVLFLVLFIYGLYILLTEKKDLAIPVYITNNNLILTVLLSRKSFRFPAFLYPKTERRTEHYANQS